MRSRAMFQISQVKIQLFGKKKSIQLISHPQEKNTNYLYWNYRAHINNHTPTLLTTSEKQVP